MAGNVETLAESADSTLDGAASNRTRGVGGLKQR